MDMAQFIQTIGISMTAEYADRNPNMDSSDMDHWRCVFHKDRARMTTYFSMGRGHSGREPTADQVLECLVSDASSIDNARGFDDWCSEYGYDTDSRKAEKTYAACKRATDKLRAFLGGDAYETLMDLETV
jgi:hypothetical protein